MTGTYGNKKSTLSKKSRQNQYFTWKPQGRQLVHWLKEAGITSYNSPYTNMRKDKMVG